MRKFIILGLLIAILLAGCASEDEEIVKIINGNDSPDTEPIMQDETPEDVDEPENVTDLNASADTDINLTANATANQTSNVTGENATEERVRIRNLTVEFIDISGNSALIRTPERKNLLIDGGSNSDGLKLVKYLINKGLVMIDYVLSSNARTENAGGLPSVIFNFNNSQAYSSGLSYNGQYVSYKSYQNYANAYSYPPIEITEDRVFDVSDHIEFEAFVPYGNESNGNPEDDTIVFRLDYDSASFLFLGDCSDVCLDNVKDNNIDADVLSVHGAVSQEVIDLVTPKIIVYDKLTNESLKPEGVKVYSKSQGTVFILSDGDKYFISTLGKT